MQSFLRVWQRGTPALFMAAAIALAMGAAQAQKAPSDASGAKQAACPPNPAQPTAAQVQQARQGAKDRGMLWRITKNGRTSHLYGTLHVGKLAWVFPGPKLSQALGQSDTLALELDPTDPQIQKDIARAMMVPSRPLTPNLSARLAVQRSAACLPPGAIDAMHPVMQVVTLSIFAAKWEGLESLFGSEPALAQQAKAAGKKVVSLETAKRQIDALMPADKADLEAELVASALDQLESNKVRPVLRRMTAAWEAGNLSELENYAAWCDCVTTAADRDLYHRINDQRNPGIADAIDALHGQGAQVFAAVGALHMTGAQALPKLMAGRGYRVERVAFDAP